MDHHIIHFKICKYNIVVNHCYRSIIEQRDVNFDGRWNAHDLVTTGRSGGGAVALVVGPLVRWGGEVLEWETSPQ